MGCEPETEFRNAAFPNQDFGNKARRSTDLRADAVQVQELFFAGEFLDLIAQDQNVKARENRAVCHGGAPPDSGVGQVNAEYTGARPDAEQ
jgi:hypothetical protein